MAQAFEKGYYLLAAVRRIRITSRPRSSRSPTTSNTAGVDSSKPPTRDAVTRAVKKRDLFVLFSGLLAVTVDLLTPHQRGDRSNDLACSSGITASYRPLAAIRLGSSRLVSRP